MSKRWGVSRSFQMHLDGGPLIHAVSNPVSNPGSKCLSACGVKYRTPMSRPERYRPPVPNTGFHVSSYDSTSTLSTERTTRKTLRPCDFLVGIRMQQINHRRNDPVRRAPSEAYSSERQQSCCKNDDLLHCPQGPIFRQDFKRGPGWETF